MLDSNNDCMCIHIQEVDSLLREPLFYDHGNMTARGVNNSQVYGGFPSTIMRKIETVRDLKGEVYKILRAGIAKGDLAPGTRLKETALVRDLAVSRTPIREALNQLSKEGLVEIIPRRGTFVKQWNKEEALEILLIREALEGLAARLATDQMTDARLDRLAGYMDRYKKGELEYTEADRLFHYEIVQACGMSRLIDMIKNLYDTLRMSKILAVSFEVPERIIESISEHNRIIEALREKDGDKVERLMRVNFQHTRGSLAKVFQ